MIHYKPPKELRPLFIIHYAPLLFIILIGPSTILFGIWRIWVNQLMAFIIGLGVFFLGTYIYFKWEIFWYKTYNGQLVTNGIFNYIRHPHYLSLLVLGFGLALFFNSVAALLTAICSIPIMICSIFDEEKLLIKQFGNEYLEYMKKVPWRIIPKLF